MLDWLSLLELRGLFCRTLARSFRRASYSEGRKICCGLGQLDGLYLRFIKAAVLPSSSSLPLSLQSLSPGDGTLNTPLGFVIGIGVFGRGICPAFSAFWAASNSAKTLPPWDSYGRAVFECPENWLVKSSDSLVRSKGRA